MVKLSIEISDQQEIFAPGDMISGKVSWQLESTAQKIFLRLFWHTQGKGTEDLEIIDKIVFNYPSQTETMPFKIGLPPSPYSFSGKLLSLIWVLELVVDDTGDSIHKEFILSPFDHEINLADTHPTR